jgi:hypothetical protein
MIRVKAVGHFQRTEQRVLTTDTITTPVLGCNGKRDLQDTELHTQQTRQISGHIQGTEQRIPATRPIATPVLVCDSECDLRVTCSDRTARQTSC